MLHPMSESIVIVGAGQAAAQLIETLRRKGFAGDLALVGDEPLLPYQRPPLSKKYLEGSFEAQRLPIRHHAFYDEHRVALELGRRAVRIDRKRRALWLDDGREFPYTTLVLATGSRARRIAVPGADLAGVHYLRSAADADAIRADARPGSHALIVGGGYIGLEVAATCRALGAPTTVLEMADRVMNRVVCEPVSKFFQAEHASHGVRIETGARLSHFAGDAHGRVRAAVMADGSERPASFVVVGIGVLAEDSLAAAAGLDCNNGIVVDEFCRSSDPSIYAIGDCANHPSPRYSTRLRLESVDNAFEQGTSAALNILGNTTPHDKVPWFWSDQYHHKLLIVGLSSGHDRVVLRGDPASSAFSACYLLGDEMIAIDTVNNAKDQMAARKLIAARARFDLARLPDAAVGLRDCVRA